MALPMKPNSGLPNVRPKAPIDALPPLSEDFALPSLELPEVSLPAPAAEEPKKAPAKRPTEEQIRKRREQLKREAATKASAHPPAQEKPRAKELPEGYARDPETGKVYKKLAGYGDDVMKHTKRFVKSGGFELSTMRKIVKLDNDFSLDDLNGSAETFLGHLRVPLDKEEQAKLREERAARDRAFEASALLNEDRDDEDELDI